MSTQRVARGMFLISSALMFAACGPSNQPELGTVRGQITLNGEPLTDAIIKFYPQSGRPSSGKSDENGEYKLTYTSQRSGALIGDHRVEISKPSGDWDGENELTPEANLIDQKYNSNSTLSATVTSGSNQIDFELQNTEAN
ncbi:transthyretin-like family protein [Calycomorphotria hydatis]|uniref:Carboxypeptidase regulatory-like domain-containing protein n=1 Tax=Calycomorphotria hydatis TaxID=2528027 RepID=A0A517T685_9PLAN|nr:hypothetical protein [Calycomorphotria hydatis]QDT63880.1 hypothetical protein V22_11060 [Calycomorphotria hydatis]